MSSYGVFARVTPFLRSRYATAVLARRSWTRGIATKEGKTREVNEKLPLAGIRVLDMTRVLAGVGLFQIELCIY